MDRRISLGLAFLLTIASVITTAACNDDAQDATAREDANANATVPGSPAGDDGASRDGEGGGRTIETQTGIPCDVDAILKTKCQTCHSSPPQFGANTALVTYEDLQKPGPGANASKKVLDLVKERIHSEVSPMPPSPKPRLDEKETSAIDSWIAAGAPNNASSCVGEAPPDSVKPLSCKADTVLKPSKPFTMQPGSPLDQYMCYGVDIDLPKKRHIIGLAPKVDNKQIVHHILLFQTNTKESSEPFACAATGSASWKLVAGWAPGGNNLELPPEAGMPQEKGTTHWVLQVHYNNATAKTGTDESGYELCTTEDLRANDAGVLAFGSISFNIPPRATHKIRCDYRLGSQFNGVKMFNASPHMHTRGSTMSTERLPGGNASKAEMVFDQKDFSFEAQANYPINASVNAGDVMRTRCGWKNPEDKSIGFGEGTGDEMCFNFVGYYPNIPDLTIAGIPLFTWITPSASASCVSE